jgi:hypothetical protein
MGKDREVNNRKEGKIATREHVRATRLALIINKPLQPRRTASIINITSQFLLAEFWRVSPSSSCHFSQEHRTTGQNKMTTTATAIAYDFYNLEGAIFRQPNSWVTDYVN